MVYRSLRFPSILVLLSLIAFSCSQNRPQQQGRQGSQRSTSLKVQTAKVQRISIQRQVDLSGTLVSPDQAHVSSEVAGKVNDGLIEIGQEVSAGQTLVRLDTTELNLAQERAESALRQTEAQLGINPSRPDQLPADESVATVRTASANLDDAKAQLARSQELVSKGLLSRLTWTQLKRESKSRRRLIRLPLKTFSP